MSHAISPESFDILAIDDLDLVTGGINWRRVGSAAMQDGVKGAIGGGVAGAVGGAVTVPGIGSVPGWVAGAGLGFAGGAIAGAAGELGTQAGIW